MRLIVIGLSLVALSFHDLEIACYCSNNSRWGGKIQKGAKKAGVVEVNGLTKISLHTRELSEFLNK
jgi:hypothetical protein